jgi:acyl-coenzyme A thioesterase PaaI-like protein
MHDDIRGQTLSARVLAATLANRTPGWNFAGHFLGIEYHSVHENNTLCFCRSRPELLTAAGQLDVSVLSVLCDIALAASARPRVGPSIRLATVSMSIYLLRALDDTSLSARSRLLRCDADSGLVTMTADVHAGPHRVATATATFLAMQTATPLAPVPLRAQAPSGGECDSATIDLTPEEQATLDRAHAADAAAPSGFLQRFWGGQLTTTEQGAEGTFETGKHTGNRVGNVQGGLLMGLAINTGQAAVGDDCQLAAVHASYIRPGRSRHIALRGQRLHRGSSTANASVAISDEAGSTLLSALVEFSRDRRP